MAKSKTKNDPFTYNFQEFQYLIDVTLSEHVKH